MRGIFWGLYYLNTLWVKNFDEIALSLTVKEIEAKLCFCIFGENLKNQNGRHFWREENFLSLYYSDTLWVKNFDEIALSLIVKEIEANLCFCIFGENLKNQNGRHVWREEIFWGLYYLYTLWVKNFEEIALSLTVKEIEAKLCFCIFGENSKNQNGRHFWREEIFWGLYYLNTLWVKNFDEIALSLTFKEIEANLCFCIFGKNSKN